MTTKAYETTLPKLLLENAARKGKKTALREKEWGVWQPFSWEDYATAAAEFAAGLKALGLGRDDVVVLIGDNRPEWLFAELAIQALGGMALGLYQDAPADEISYVFELSEAKLVVAEDQEQVDKMLCIRETVPSLQYVVYHDPKGLSQYETDGLMSFEQVRELGKERAGEFPRWVDELTPDDKRARSKAWKDTGIQICIELIQEMREIEGVSGVHVMAIEWESRVPEITERANVFPRPSVD